MNLTAIDKEVLDIVVKPGKDSNPNKVKLKSWKVVDFRRKEFDI
jgi:hypothetical protein